MIVNAPQRIAAANIAVRENPLLEGALWCALELGAPVLPLNWPVETGEHPKCSCPKGYTCTWPGKCPHGLLVRNGVNGATTDERTIRGWWRRFPTCNVGVRTGQQLPSGLYLVVLDVDPRESGDFALAQLEAQHDEIPHTLTVNTGGNGTHHYLSTPHAQRSRKLAPGLEVKAEGTYVVAPPSLHCSGRRYAWGHLS